MSTTPSLTGLQPLQALYEAPLLPTYELPDGRAAAHSGQLGSTEPRLYANFVADRDGVTAIPADPILIGAAQPAGNANGGTP
jgi:hypothetical protein